MSPPLWPPLASPPLCPLRYGLLFEPLRYRLARYRLASPSLGPGLGIGCSFSPDHRPSRTEPLPVPASNGITSRLERSYGALFSEPFPNPATPRVQRDQVQFGSVAIGERMGPIEVTPMQPPPQHTTTGNPSPDTNTPFSDGSAASVYPPPPQGTARAGGARNAHAEGERECRRGGEGGGEGRGRGGRRVEGARGPWGGVLVAGGDTGGSRAHLRLVCLA